METLFKGRQELTLPLAGGKARRAAAAGQMQVASARIVTVRLYLIDSECIGDGVKRRRWAQDIDVNSNVHRSIKRCAQQQLELPCIANSCSIMEMTSERQESWFLCPSCLSHTAADAHLEPSLGSRNDISSHSTTLLISTLWLRGMGSDIDGREQRLRVQVT